MKLTDSEKSIIEKIVNCFETSSPTGNYAAISKYHDGPHNIKQITYGRSQTTEYGNLRELIHKYIVEDGIYSDQLKPYAEQVGSFPLVNNQKFIQLLKDAGKNDPIMKVAQDQFFDERYFIPAMKWADTNGFKLQLSAAVIYDSHIHSGSILWIIRQKFAENPPVLGGDEKTWITEYVKARDLWLGSHSNQIVRKTTYRTQTFVQEINRGNWDLSQLPIYTKNGCKVS